MLNILSLLRESDFLRVTTDTVIGGASKQCTHNSNYDPNFSYVSLLVGSGGNDFQQKHSVRDEKVVCFNAANGLLSFVIATAFLMAKAVARQRHRVWKNSLSDDARTSLLAKGTS